MKKSVLMLSLVAGMVLASCAPKEEKPAEVIVIEHPVEQPVQQAAPVEQQPENSTGTSIEVDKDGIKINSDKTNVDLKDNKAKVEIKN